MRHVKAHRTKEEKNMSLFEHIPSWKGMTKPDELANDGAMQEGGNSAQIRASSVQQRRRDLYAALQYAASFHCLVEKWTYCEELKTKLRDKWIFIEKKEGGQGSQNGLRPARSTVV